MGRTIIELDDTQVEPLRALAAKDGRSIETIVRDALGDYLRREAERDRYFERFFGTAEEIHSRLPPDITPAEIEADITAAREEVRAMRRATRGR